jgi:hypothetical protein
MIEFIKYILIFVFSCAGCILILGIIIRLSVSYLLLDNYIEIKFYGISHRKIYYKNIQEIAYWDREKSLKNLWYTFVFRERTSDLFRYFNPVVMVMNGSTFKVLITPPNPEQFVEKVIALKSQIKPEETQLNPAMRQIAK